MRQEIEITLTQLRGMIGQEVIYQGIACRVIEVLEDGPSLVLEDLSARSLQADRFGDPRRHVPDTYTVPVLEPDRCAIHAAFLELDLVDRSRR